MKGKDTAVMQSKPSRLVSIIAAIVLLVTVVGAIVLGLILPKSKLLTIPQGEVNSITATADEKIYVASTDGNVFRLDEGGDVEYTFELAKVGEESFGLSELGEVTHIQTEASFEYVWAFTSSRYLFQLKEEDGKLNVVDYVALKGNLMGLKEKNGKLYLVEQDGRMGYFKKFDLSKKLAEGLVSDGYIYKPAESPKGTLVLTPDSPGILSFDIIEANGVEYAYILHSSGLIRMATDCTQNRWKILYQEESDAAYEVLYQNAVSAKFEELKAAAGAGADETALAAEAKAAVDGNETVLKDLRNEANALAVDALKTKYGITEYDAGKGHVKMPTASFDLGKYNYYSADSVTYRGCVYIEDKHTYYIVTEGDNMIACDALQQFRTDGASIRKFRHTEVAGVKLPERPMAGGNAISHDKVNNVGYVLYMNSDSISRIDFNTMEISYTAAEEFNIRSIVSSSSGDKIFYLYTNPYEATSGNLLLRSSSIAGKENENLLKAFFTILIVLAVCAAITLAFALGCFFSEKFSVKFMDVMRGFKKQWAIYAIIAGSMVLVAMFCYYPAVASIGLSFFDYTQEKPARLWNHFAHYKYIFTTEGAWSEFANMLLFLCSDLFTAILPPLIFAFFLTIMRNKKYSAITRTLLFIPGIIPGVATTLIWKTGIYGTYGVLNTIIRLLNGETVEFLTQSATAKWSLILMGFPFVGSYLIFYGAMMNVPDSYYEAAEMDGITVVKRFVFIDVPLIFAQIKYVFIMTFISSVQNFGRTYMTTAGSWDTTTPVHTMYEYVNKGNYGRASAYATVLFVFLFFATVVNLRMKGKENEGA